MNSFVFIMVKVFFLWMLKSETNSNIMPTTAALPQMISFCSTLFITLSKMSLRKTDVICHDGGFYYPKFHYSLILCWQCSFEMETEHKENNILNTKLVHLRLSRCHQFLLSVCGKRCVYYDIFYSTVFLCFITLSIFFFP